MSRPFCHVQPEHVNLMRVFGASLIVGCVVALFTGKAYFREVVLREERPVEFWVTVGLTFMLGSMCLVGSFVC